MSERIEIWIEGHDGLTRPAQAANKSLSALDKNAAQTGKQIHGMGEHAKHAAGQMKGMDMMMAGMSLTMLSLPFVAVAKQGIAFNAMLEQAEIAFTTMIGSVQGAKDHLEDLLDFAKRTPFRQEEVVKASRMMQAYGFAVAEVLPMLKAVGDAASGLGLRGEGIERIVRALGQMQAKGRVMSQEMLQLTETGIPAWQILSDKMGITTGELMKMVEKGIVPADQAIRLLIDGMSKKFPDMMEKQSKTFLGLLSNLQDSLEIAMGKMTVGVFDAIKPALERLVSLLSSSAFDEFVDRWGGIIGAVTLATGGLLAAGAAVLGLAAAITMLGPGLAVIGGLAVPVGTLAIAVAGLGAAWWNNWGNIRDRTAEVVEQIRPKIQDLIGFLDNNLGTALQVSAVAIGGWAAFTVGRFLFVGTEATVMAGKVSVAFATTMAASIATAVPTMLAALAPFVPTLLLIGGAAAILATIWSQNWGNIQEKTTAIVKFIVEDTDKVFEAILKLMPMAGLLRDAWARDLKDLMDIYKKTAEYIRDRTEDMRRWNEERLGIQQSTTPGSRESTQGGKYTRRETAIPAHGLIPDPPKLAIVAHESGKASAGNFVTAFIEQFKSGFPEVQRLIKEMFGNVTKIFTDADTNAKLKAAERMMRGFLEVPAAIARTADNAIPMLEEMGKKAKEAGISISELKNALIALHPATLAAAVAVAYWESQIEAVNLALVANRDQLRAAQAEYDRLGESLRAAQAEYGRMADALAGLNEKLSVAKARLADLANPQLVGMGQMSKEIAAIERQLKRLSLAELGLPTAEEVQKQFAGTERTVEKGGTTYKMFGITAAEAEEKLAEMRKKALADVLTQFPEMTEEMKNYLATLPPTKEGLQKALETLRLTKDLKFDEALQKIKDAAEGVKTEMTFEEAMKQIADTKAEIAGLTGAITTQEAAMQAQQAVIDSINVSMENQRAVIAEIQRAGDALNATLAAFQAELEGAKAKQDLINTALGLAYKWFLDDKDAVTAMGTEGVRVAGVMDVKTTALLAAIEKAATDTTGTATTALGTMVTAYQADMAKAIVEVIGKDGKGGLVGTLEKIKPPIDDAVLSTNALKRAIDALEDKTITITTVHKSVGQGGGGDSTSEKSEPKGASGLDFRVGGSGGIDSQLVKFWSSPGARVIEIPPGRSGERMDYQKLGQAVATALRQSGAGKQLNLTINSRADTENVEASFAVMEALAGV